MKRKTLDMILLKNLDVGTNGFFEYCSTTLRISFMKSLTHLTVCPILHRNMNKFMGMATCDSYMTYKVDKDKMYALTMDGMLFCWSVTTGKLLSKVTLEGHDYSDYDLVSPCKEGRVLLKSKENLEGL